MTILRTDKIAGLESVNAITGSVFFGRNGTTAVASGNWLTAYSADDFKFGTGDFTIEYWFYFTGISGSNSGSFQISNTIGGLNNQNTASAGGLALNYENGCIKGIGNNGWFNGTNSVAVETWNHVALVRYSGTLQIFTNGVADTSASDSQNYSLTHLAIGGYYSTSHLFQGYISNFRIQKGKAEYTGAFTPPTRQLEVTPETVLLACQSSSNIFQEATGKTINEIRVSAGDAPPLSSTFVPDVGNDHTYGTVLEGNVEFPSLNYMTLPRGTTAQANRGRGLIMGGATPSPTPTTISEISYIDIASSGTNVLFGDLTMARYASGAFASSTRGMLGGGRVPGSRTDRIDYVTIATTGDAIDFGNLHDVNAYNTGASNQTRGLWFGGNTPTYITRIDYVTIASSGMDALDFGDLTDARHGGPAAASPTKAVCMGGYDGSSYVTRIDSVTIATTGSEATFGELATANAYGGGVSNATRAIAGGGGGGGGDNNIMEYITFATSGNGNDFGDLLYPREHVGAVSNSTRGVWFGGVTPTYQSDIQYVIINTLGNGVDWGDLSVKATAGSTSYTRGYSLGTSDSHGGLI